MKRLTEKQTALFIELLPQIAKYRSLQAKADSIEVVDFESADLLASAAIAAGDALGNIEFWVQEAYASVPYRQTRNQAIDSFMALVVGEE